MHIYSYMYTHTHTHTHIYIYIYIFYDPFATFIQLTQQIYVAKEWVKNARDEVKAEAHSRLEVEKAL